MIRRRRSALATGFQTFVGMLLLSIGFLATLGTVLGFLGSFWWAFDVLSSFRAQYAVVLIAVAVVYGLGFGRGSAGVFLAAGLANVALVLPLYLTSPAPQNPDATGDVTIVSFNVGVSNPARQPILEWVGASGADLVFLEEGSADWDTPIRNADIPYTVIAEPPPDRQFGMIALARVPADVETLRIGESRDVALKIITELDGGPVTIYAIHPRSPTNEMRTAARNELLEGVAELVAQEDGPVVVIGDFNATRWSSAFRALQRRGDLVDSMNGYGFQPSWPSINYVLSIPIDNMLHTDDLTTLARSTGPDLGSDHLPLVVRVGFADRA